MAESEETKMAEIIEEDRISALPDSVLCHILSFLPTVHSVATSTLSKRWTHLWRFVPVLSFSDTDVEGLSEAEASLRLSRLVHFVLLLRDPTQTIESFSLNTQNPLDFNSLNHSISVLLQRKVPILQFIFDGSITDILPHGILSCKTLVVLKLDCLNVKSSSPIALPSLKILHLYEVNLPHPQYLMELLAACPILEDFSGRCLDGWTDLDNYDDEGGFKSFRLPKLVRAHISVLDFEFPLEVFSDVEYLSIDHTPVRSDDDDIPTFHNLTRMDCVFFDYHWCRDILIQLLRKTPGLEHLFLSIEEIDYEASPAIWVDPGFVPACILLHLRTCTLEDFRGLQYELQLARYIMKNAKVLCSMTIYYEANVSEGETQIIEENLSSCPRSSTTCQLSCQPSIW